MNEYQAVKAIFYEQNKPRFIKVIDRALLKHNELLQQKTAVASKRVEENSV